MNVLVFNCGSSSLKYRLLEMPSERELAGGEAQRVGPKTAEPGRVFHRIGGVQEAHRADMADHAAAFEEVMRLLARDPRLVPDAVGHRVVHGGAIFAAPTVVDSSVLERLEATRALAPLHNPPAMALMAACQARYPRLPQVAVFDTAFHATIPDYAYTYAVPLALRRDLGIRKYGFHGTSHQFVAEEASRLLGKPMASLNAVSCHLGSGGASLCAIVNGQSVDNTMGYSPLQGLVMSTRSGDIDPAVVMNLLALSGGNGDGVDALLNKRSGVLGLSGVSADIRDVIASLSGAATGDTRGERTLEVYLWRIRKYLGAYLTVVGRADAVIFTDTIGETEPHVRWAVCAGLEVFGLHLDPELNRRATALPTDIAAPDSRVRALVIATNEELAIARQTYATAVKLRLRPTNECSVVRGNQARLDRHATLRNGQAQEIVS